MTIFQNAIRVCTGFSLLIGMLSMLPSTATAQLNSYLDDSRALIDRSVLVASPVTSSNLNRVSTTDFFSDASSQAPSGRPKGFPVGLGSEWLTDSDSGLVTTNASLKLPLLFGRNNSSGPPPIVKVGFAYTDLFAAESFGLPDGLYETSIGLSWMRRFNDRWSVRTMLGIAYATDNENTSSDAWQFRGGVFAIYKRSERWQWTIGAIALGRRDLPVLPAIGAVWQVDNRTRVDFMLPQPKVNFLLADDGQRQQWAYLGCGLNGNTWAYETTSLADDQLTYSDLRLVAGWESKPTPPPGVPFAPGRKFGIEVGYAFSRDFEFADETIKSELDDSLMLRVTTSF